MNWKEIPISAISGFSIGHAQNDDSGTGCTVILPAGQAVCGLDVRGGGPASRETQLLNPMMSNTGIHGLLLSGGSAYGLDAAAGVMQYLEEQGKGVAVGDAVVPIVVGSCIFDLNCGDGKVRPDARMGYDACVDSQRKEVRMGNVGAGTGATVGKMLGNERTMKSGLGCYAVEIGSLQVGAVVVVNAIGDVFELDSQKELAGLLSADGKTMISTEETMVALLQTPANFCQNTTIGAIVTNAKLDKASMNKVAAMASNGLARTIRPVNTSMDGDSIYAMALGEVTSSPDVVGTLAAHVLGKAINRAVLRTESRYGFQAACDL